MGQRLRQTDIASAMRLAHGWRGFWCQSRRGAAIRRWQSTGCPSSLCHPNVQKGWSTCRAKDDAVSRDLIAAALNILRRKFTYSLTVFQDSAKERLSLLLICENDASTISAWLAIWMALAGTRHTCCHR